GGGGGGGWGWGGGGEGGGGGGGGEGEGGRGGGGGGGGGGGEEWGEAIWADWGNKDFQDDMAMVDYAVEQGIADPAKLAVGGWSYGGISTDFIIAQTNRFKAVISGAGAGLFVSFYRHDHYQRDYEAEVGHARQSKPVAE